LIDLGPEGGAGGGRILVSGTPEKVAATKTSHTGRFLLPHLKPATPVAKVATPKAAPKKTAAKKAAPAKKKKKTA
jgi:excinuclease ABC subunit A